MLGVPVEDEAGPAEGGMDGEVAVVDIDTDVGVFDCAVEGGYHAGGVADHDDGGHGLEEGIWEDGGVGAGG